MFVTTSHLLSLGYCLRLTQPYRPGQSVDLLIQAELNDELRQLFIINRPSHKFAHRQGCLRESKSLVIRIVINK